MDYDGGGKTDCELIEPHIDYAPLMLEMWAGDAPHARHLLKQKKCNMTIAVDLNKDALALASSKDARIRTFKSDVWDSVPKMEVDYIVGNPPHFNKKNATKGRRSEVLYDYNWISHKKFFEKAHEYLKKGGRVYIYENRYGMTKEKFANLTKDSPLIIKKIIDLKGWLGRSPVPFDYLFNWIANPHLNPYYLVIMEKKFEDKTERENDKMFKGYLIDGKIKIKLEK